MKGSCIIRKSLHQTIGSVGDLSVTRNPSSYRNLMRTISHCFIGLAKGLLCPHLLCFVFLQSLWIENKYYSSHFSDEETEGQKSKVILRSQRKFL